MCIPGGGCFAALPVIMKLLCWNCRGLGNPRTVNEPHFLVKERAPLVIFLSETKINKSKVEKVRYKLGMEQSFVVDSLGKSGGLAMLWKSEVNAQLHTYSHNHISLTITPEFGGHPWRLSGFYGNPASDKRKESWNLLRLLSPEYSVAWLCMRDFNEILSNEEKFGSVTRSFSQMESFRSALDDWTYRVKVYLE